MCQPLSASRHAVTPDPVADGSLASTDDSPDRRFDIPGSFRCSTRTRDSVQSHESVPSSTTHSKLIFQQGSPVIRDAKAARQSDRNCRPFAQVHFPSGDARCDSPEPVRSASPLVPPDPSTTSPTPCDHSPQAPWSESLRPAVLAENHAGQSPPDHQSVQLAGLTRPGSAPHPPVSSHAVELPVASHNAPSTRRQTSPAQPPFQPASPDPQSHPLQRTPRHPESSVPTPQHPSPSTAPTPPSHCPVPASGLLAPASTSRMPRSNPLPGHQAPPVAP